MLGLGVYQVDRDATSRAVGWALEAGYRHVDTAQMYDNEAQVGGAVRASGLDRERVFITTKLHPDLMSYEFALVSFERSLRQLGVDYVDLFLIHWPGGRDRRGAWKALEELHRDGRAHAIGVSNYTLRHLREMDDYAEVAPMVNQVEFHPFLYQRALLECCAERGMVLVAYSPLGRGRLLNDPTIADVARTLGRSSAQVMLRWSIQHGCAVIPKSVHRDRIVENAAVFDFEIPEDAMNRLDALDNGTRTAWNPEPVA